jgi:hypothetical protein
VDAVTDGDKKLYEQLGAQLKRLDVLTFQRNALLKGIAKTRKGLNLSSNAVKPDVT